MSSEALNLASLLPESITPEQFMGLSLAAVTVLGLILISIGRDFLRRLNSCVAVVEKGAEDWSASCERIASVSETTNDRIDAIERRVSPLETDVVGLKKIDYVALGRSVDRLDERLKGMEERDGTRDRQIQELTAQMGLLVKEGEGIRTMVKDLWERRAVPRARGRN